MSNIDMLVLIHEQLNVYTAKLRKVEKEMIRKYKAGEDYQEELTKAQGLKMLQAQTANMMATYGSIK